MEFSFKNSGIEFKQTMTYIPSQFNHNKVIVYIDNIRVHVQISKSKILTIPDFILTKKYVFPDLQKPTK